MALKYLDRPIAYHRVFVDIAGSVSGAVFLSQLVYWSKRSKHPGKWFYKSGKDWNEETGLSRSEQERAIKMLIGKGVLKKELRGVPATLWFNLIEDRLEYELEMIDFKKAQFAESNKLDCKTKQTGLQNQTNQVAELGKQDSPDQQTTTETTKLLPENTTGSILLDAFENPLPDDHHGSHFCIKSTWMPTVSMIEKTTGIPHDLVMEYTQSFIKFWMEEGDRAKKRKGFIAWSELFSKHCWVNFGKHNRKPVKQRKQKENIYCAAHKDAPIPEVETTDKPELGEKAVKEMKETLGIADKSAR